LVKGCCHAVMSPRQRFCREQADRRWQGPLGSKYQVLKSVFGRFYSNPRFLKFPFLMLVKIAKVDSTYNSTKTSSQVTFLCLVPVLSAILFVVKYKSHAILSKVGSGFPAVHARCLGNSL